MSENISREAALELLKEAEYKESSLNVAGTMICAIRDLPAADVAPVVHAEWVEWYPGDIALIMTGEEMLWECSHCTAKYAERSNYCPNCGARMDMNGEVQG